MFGWGIGFVAVGVLSFVLPMLGRQLILVTLLGLTGFGSAVAGLVLIVLGFALLFIASQRGSNKSPQSVGYAKSQSASRVSDDASGADTTKQVQHEGITANENSRDEWFIQQTEALLAPLAQVVDVKLTALEIFKSTKKELAALKDVDMYSKCVGDRIVSIPSDMLLKRLAAGLTREDIRNYWNQPPLMQRIQSKSQDFSIFIAIKNAEIARLDVIEVIRNRRKTRLWLGDPDTWDPSMPVNKGFSDEDADIYPEFTMRVGIWASNVAPSEQTILPSKYSSFNAMVRHLIRNGIV
ncbi:hypothetical protein [Roseateles sp.]|uniref:hypothetical protein n=1 Tax=Roseateles sp. TaxID=1971397 RepID=UPI003263A802